MCSISKIRFAPYELSFKEPLKTSEGVLTNRKGLVLEFQTAKHHALAEIAPLPGYSSESLEDVELALREVLPLFLTGLSQAKALIKELPSGLPSLSFGLESAVFELLAKQKDMPLANFLNKDAKEKLVSNTVLFPGMPFDNELAIKGTVKIKVSPKNYLQVLELLKTIPKDVKVRLDANQSFTLEGIKDFLFSLEPSQIDYIEEPIKDLSKLKSLKQNFPLQIALDESLYQNTSTEDIRFDVAILKPTMTGGPSFLKALVDSCYKRDLRVVFTSALENIVAINTSKQLARALLKESEVCGFDTLGLFREEMPNKIENLSQVPGIKLEEAHEL